jgi:type VI secretion system secreted protein VgrG
MENQQEHVQITIGGRPFEVVALKGEEHISRLFRFDVVCRAEGGSAPTPSLVAAEAKITLYDGFGAERTISGLVAEAIDRISDEGTTELTVTVRPHAYTLSLGRSSRVYQHKTVVDIVKDILGRCAQKTKWELVGSYKPHEYCAQYREDDLSFAMRMLEEEGIHFRFDHEGVTTMVFDDSSTIGPELPGGGAIEYAYRSGMRADHELIEEIGNVGQVLPTRFTIYSFNHQNPKLSVHGAAGEGALHVYDAPGGGPDSPDACARRAHFMKESAGSHSRGVAGKSTSVRLVPGTVLRVVGGPLGGDGRYLVTRAVYEISQRRRGTGAGELSYQCHFEGIPAKVSFRPPAEVPPGKQTGLQTGKVVGASGDEVMPDSTGRVRVQLHWDREGGWNDQAGKWMRVAQRGTEESMLLPRVGWNVLTLNDEGEIDAPFVLSRIHDAEHPPTYSLPGHKTRVVWKTATTPGGGSHNEVYFEDKKGNEELFMNASKDMIVYANQVKSESITHDSVRQVGANHSMTVGKSATETVLGNQRVTIGADEKITVGNGRLKEVEKDEKITIGGQRKIHTGYQHTIAVTKKRSLEVGAAMIEKTTGLMSTVAGEDFKATIGGVDLKISKKSITEDTGKIAKQTVGAAKVELSGKDMPADTGKTYKEEVGVAMFLKAGGAFTDGATKTSKWKVKGMVKANAPDVYAEAIDKIEIKCGASVMTILPDSVQISSPSLDLSGSELIVETQKVEHN